MTRILVTNDDGIDSVGLHVLARAMVPLGEVVVVAPNSEYSGASAALGALHLLQPEVHRVTVTGVPEAWTVNGPPGLCVMFARLGVFGPVDLVVSGINPGANVGRAIYHSGTVGAVLTARNGGTSGVAVSQAVANFGVEGQGWDEMVAGQHWETAARVAAEVVGSVLALQPSDAFVVNVNVPNLPFEELAGLAPRHRGPAADADGGVRPAAPDRRARRRLLGRDDVGRRDRAAAGDRHRRRRARGRGHLVPQPPAARGAHRPRSRRRRAGHPARGGSYTPDMSEIGVDRRAEWDALRDRYLQPKGERPPSTARGVHHTAHLSSDVARTIDFYQGLLGFPLTELFENRDYQGSTHFFFDIGNGNALAFFDFPGLDLGPYAEVLGGHHHLAISVEPAQWRELKGRLEAAGVELHEVSGTSLYFRGPDGERLELIADPLGEMYGMSVV